MFEGVQAVKFGERTRGLLVSSHQMPPPSLLALQRENLQFSSVGDEPLQTTPPP